jgi:hypothetical protein
MKPISLALPKGAKVTGEILRDYSAAPRRLGQDILQVTLVTGRTVDVGWCPAYDPGGSFQIVVYGEGWNDQLVDPIWVKLPLTAARIVEMLAEEFSRPLIAVSASAGRTFDWPSPTPSTRRTVVGSA